MNKIKNKSMKAIVFMVLTITISFTAGVCAESMIKNISAQLRPDFTITMNNEKQILKDVNGKIIDPILYEGTTYLPIRAVANIVGKDVEWDNETKLISISDPNLSQKESIYINGKLSVLNTFKIQGSYYFDIVELQGALNNLELEIDEDENIHIYERTGLGIINRDGEEYVDFKNIANRYSGEESEFLPIEWEPKQSEPSFTKKIQDDSNLGVGPRSYLVSVGDHFYDGWFYKKDRFKEQLSELLDIIKENEVYILANPNYSIY